MDALKIVGVATGLSAIFSAGFVYGSISTSKSIEKRLEKVAPLLANSIVDFFMFHRDTPMSKEEMRTLLDIESQFIDIAVRSKE